MEVRTACGDRESELRPFLRPTNHWTDSDLERSVVVEIVGILRFLVTFSRDWTRLPFDQDQPRYNLSTLSNQFLVQPHSIGFQHTFAMDIPGVLLPSITNHNTLPPLNPIKRQRVDGDDPFMPKRQYGQPAGSMPPPRAPIDAFSRRTPLLPPAYPASAIPPYNLRTAIDSIDHEQLKNYIYQLATIPYHSHSLVANWIYERHHEKIMAEQARVINFDKNSKNVWYELNVAHKRESGSRQYESAFDAHSYVCEVIASIETHVKYHSSYATKKSALETLRKIGKTICLTGDTIGSEVRKQFGHGDELDSAMLAILGQMSSDETEQMAKEDDGDGKGTFDNKMDNLVGLCESYSVFNGMGEVLTILRSEDVEDEDEEEDEGEDEIEEDEEDPYAEDEE